MVVVIVQNKGILLHYRLYDQSNVFRHGNYCFYFFIFNFWLLFLCTKGCLFDGGYFSKNLNSNFRGQIVHFRGHIVHFGAVTHHYIDLTALNAGKGTEIITLSMHTIYHSDHTIPMIPASYRMHG